MQEVTARIGDQGRLRMGVERATNVVHTGHNTAGGPEPARRDLPPEFLPTPNRIAEPIRPRAATAWTTTGRSGNAPLAMS